MLFNVFLTENSDMANVKDTNYERLCVSRNICWEVVNSLNKF